ncbi:hypothetical protein ACWD0A_05715 [Streptomyces sp. NPDC002867]
MDPLAAAAATALVGAMATDAWQQARTSAVELWRRVHPERVPAVEAELAEVRAEVLEARQSNDPETEGHLASDWQRRLQRLLREDPDLARELRRVLDEELTPLLPTAEDRSHHGTLVQEARASGGSHIYQAGGDQTNIHR